MSNQIEHTTTFSPDGITGYEVHYTIRDIEVLEDDGNTVLSFDYDVSGLLPEHSQEFEKYLGNLIISALEDAIKEGQKEDE